MISACTTVPVGHSLPDIPKEITDRCPVLFMVADDEQKLSELLKIVGQNYTLYYECVSKQQVLVEWYAKQKKIHDDVHKGK
jgi:hypothetical protein